MNEAALRHAARFAGKATVLGGIPTVLALSTNEPNWRLSLSVVAVLLVVYALFDEVERMTG
ncbi:MAG: hypothetical protein ABEJ76_00165 [Halanaeroarchaeum sp.]